MTLGEKIKYHRERNGFTQDEVATHLNTSPQNVYKYEKGIITNIPLKNLVAMATMFGISPVELTDWDEKLPANSGEELSEEESLLVGLFRKLRPDQKDMVIHMIRAAAEAM